MTMLALASDERMPYRTADTREMIVVHRALLRYTNYLATVAPTIDTADEVAVQTARAVAVELVGALRALDAAHKELLWPTLLGYLDATGTDTDSIATVAQRHDDLGTWCTAVVRAIGTAGFAAAVAGLAENLTRQLAEVERVAFPAAERYMTERQWRDLVERFVAELGAGERGHLLLGGLLYAGSRRERGRIARGSRRGKLTAIAYRRTFDKRFAAVQSVLGCERPAQ